MNFDAYLDSCYRHLSSEQKQNDGSFLPYYGKASESDLKAAKKEIYDVLKEAYDSKIITKQDFDAMNPDEKGPAKFYELFRVHKEHQVGKPPPERPIISASGSITENIGHYVQSHLKHYSNLIPSYLQDSPDFLRSIEREINDANLIEDGDIIATIDVSSLYTNINQQERINACRWIPEKYSSDKDKNEFIIKLLSLILKHSIF